MAKTVISFANDAGGDIYIGIKDKPRKIVGVNDIEIQKLEGMLSNSIHDNCTPVIVTEIEFVNFKKIIIIKIHIHKGIEPPYYLTSKGIDQGTFIRIGSNNRLTSSEIIEELKRQKNRISFDDEITASKILEDSLLSSFEDLFLDKTNEKLTKQALKNYVYTKQIKGLISQLMP